MGYQPVSDLIMNEINPVPGWQKDFPVGQRAEHKASRREFAKFFVCALLGGAGVAAGRHFLEPARREHFPPRAVAKSDELDVGGYKLFRYPTQDDPCILIRLESHRYVAFSQSCTHLMCPVYFEAVKRQLVCPCHQGLFDAVDGRPLAGPPQRPLEHYRVEARDGWLWVS
jgi:Rieske Fe-S protein